MKSYLLTIATLCFFSTGFNLPIDAQDNFNYGFTNTKLNPSESLLTDLARGELYSEAAIFLPEAIAQF